MLEERWTSDTLRFGFTAVPNLLLRVNALPATRGPERLTPAELFVLLLILSSWIDNSIPPFPSIARMANYTGISSRHVRRIIQNLVAKGYIEKKQFSGSWRRKNVYDLAPLVMRLHKSAAEIETSLENIETRRLTRLEMAEDLGLIKSEFSDQNEIQF